MNRNKRRLILLLVIALLLLVFGLLCFPRQFETVATDDHLKFGMTPLEVRIRYGAPDETDKSAVAPGITYTYFEEFDGKPSVCSYTFIRDRLFYRLYDASTIIEASESEAAAIYKTLIEKCRAEYRPASEQADETCTELDVTDGAISLHCKIEMEQTTVSVRITRIW